MKGHIFPYLSICCIGTQVIMIMNIGKRIYLNDCFNPLCFSIPKIYQAVPILYHCYFKITEIIWAPVGRW